VTSLAGQMPDIDDTIFDEIGETLVSGTNEAKGIFQNKYREVEYPNGTIVGLDISFDCQWQSWMDSLSEGDAVTIEFTDTDKADESYVFRRRLPRTGDESGLVILELGRSM
jgi:hypothetical protein